MRPPDLTQLSTDAQRRVERYDRALWYQGNQAAPDVSQLPLVTAHQVCPEEHRPASDACTRVIEQAEDRQSQGAFARTAFPYKTQILPGENVNPDTPENISFLRVFDREICREYGRDLPNFASVAQSHRGTDVRHSRIRGVVMRKGMNC